MTTGDFRWVDVVFLHFGMGVLALLLRTLSRPFIRCCKRFATCFLNCLFCCCCFSDCQRRAGRKVLDLCEAVCSSGVVTFLLSRVCLRWYWFHLSMQVAFMTREYLIIDRAHGWNNEIIAAHAAIWLTLFIVTVEVWNFSKVRNENIVTKLTVDGLLDMLLLPVNLGFFMQLSVRLLTLSNDHSGMEDSQSGAMISIIIESADIWEALALWSVLDIFVRVVDVESQRLPDIQSLVSSFKNLSLQGVKTWVFIMAGIVATNVVMNGVLEIHVPTLCSRLSSSCQTCSDLYHHNVHAAATAVNFILCSFALVFVFTFEHAFEEHLAKIEPFWKFWGVKGVVSVTYFQWIVLSLGPWELSSSRVYLWHCLLCSLEMPILALVHVIRAYPFGKPWLEFLLECQVKGLEEQVRRHSAAENSVRKLTLISSPSSSQDRSSPPSFAAMSDRITSLSPSASNRPSLASQQPAAGSSECELRAVTAGEDLESRPREGTLPGEELESRSREGKQPSLERPRETHGAEDWEEPTFSFGRGTSALPPEQHVSLMSRSRHREGCCSLLFYWTFWGASCTASSRFVLSVLPPEDELVPKSPVFNFTCPEDMEYYMDHEKTRDLHLVFVNDTMEAFRSKESGRAWLPLCSKVVVGCQQGYRGQVELSCSGVGSYDMNGKCEPNRCGEPPSCENAKIRKSGHAWKTGEVVEYDCNEGFHGNPRADCTAAGNYSLRCDCKLVTCGEPPSVAHASPVRDKDEGDSTNWTRQIGQHVRYQCDEKFGGSPRAVCGPDGQYVLSHEGRCMALCNDPPAVEHAVPKASSMPAGGWVQGQLMEYSCKAGFGGTVVATCGGEGDFRVDGECKRQCENLEEFLDGKLGKHWRKNMERYGDGLDLTESGAKDVIRFRCNWGRVGKPWAVCFEGKWSLHGTCKPFQTISGCSCKVEWDACKDLLGSDCERWYGCYDQGESGDGSWCEVNSSTHCVGDEEPPAWDYCVMAGRAKATWPKQKVPPRGPHRKVQMGLAAGALLLLTAVAFLLRYGYRKVSARSSLMPPPGGQLHPAATGSSGDAASRASGFDSSSATPLAEVSAQPSLMAPPGQLAPTAARSSGDAVSRASGFDSVSVSARSSLTPPPSQLSPMAARSLGDVASRASVSDRISVSARSSLTPPLGQLAPAAARSSGDATSGACGFDSSSATPPT